MADRFRKQLSRISRSFNLKGMIRLSGQHVIFPFYHVVSDEYLPHIRHLYRYWNVDQFRSDLDEMLKLFEPLSLSEYLEGKGNIKGKRSMVLSFDDGLWECHQIIAPILKEKGVPAVFFLNNQFIDNRGLFYRYKASIIIDRLLSDCKSKEKAAEYLVIPEDQVVDALMMVNYSQQALLDAMAPEVDVDFKVYVEDCPVYMNSHQVMELLDQGFEIGAHSTDHADLALLGQEEQLDQVRSSVGDLQRRFVGASGNFAFPFTSDGVPASVIYRLLENKHATALMGTAGLKKTGMRDFIQRIPMEWLELDAITVLKTRYLSYLIKAPLGMNRLRF